MEVLEKQHKRAGRGKLFLLEKQHFALDRPEISRTLHLVPRQVPDSFSRRERQIMDLLWRRTSATAAELHAALPDPPTYSAVRALLAVLVQKGHLHTRADGRRYIYEPTVPRDAMRKGALRRLLDTFFDSSAENLVAALLDSKARKLKPNELTRIRALIDQHTAKSRP
jgi:predicted transcriptional regulator